MRCAKITYRNYDCRYYVTCLTDHTLGKKKRMNCKKCLKYLKDPDWVKTHFLDLIEEIVDYG